ncbi:uncharacterized protein N7483_008401 [Penicillium malachiteum]|uniref:uncharacterized protein n=1 Tax=Penicillium malachiteum TaxID=1324776 RepID=UPI0025497C49|nr:uncharacterized protein N7483_008401 [Penicillium malachiteum]KAJ5720467.1 hypothetical protein N7483_008401 [Penicillium malachiteum]
MSASDPSRDTAIREAKIFVREVVRNDWEFTTNPDGSYLSLPPPTDNDAGTLYQNRKVTEWRSREFDSSGSELEPQSSDQDSDDDSQKALDDPATELRRKRRRQMEEEMAWNKGLRMWMARRDAWSGARTRRQIRAKGKNRAILQPGKDSSQATGTAAADGLDSGVDAAPPAPCLGSSPHSDRQSQNTTDVLGLATKTDSSLSISKQEKIEERHRREDAEEGQSTAADEEAKHKESTETSITEPDSQSNPTLTKFPSIDDDEQDTDEELDELLIPVAPPFLAPDNPVRATITPTIYPSIYTKVVVQGMTPTVPVNLADLTKAMVQGWKADGQWPPKPAVSSIVLADDATVPKKASDNADASPQSRRKNSITSAMRKVFHLGSHPFHRRGSASQDGGNGASAGNSGSVV